MSTVFCKCELPLKLPMRRAKPVSKAPDRLYCVYCPGILYGDVKMLQCGHRICEHCLQDIREGGKTKLADQSDVTCPGADDECREYTLTGSIIFTDRGTMKERDKLIVYCPFTEYGCTKQDIWVVIEDHVTECSYYPVECANKPYGCVLIVGKCKLEEHLVECECRPVLCNFCDNKVSLKDINDGHENQCSSSPQQCMFKDIGCTTVAIPKSMKQHGKDSMGAHLELLARALDDLKLGPDLKEQIEHLATDSRAMKSELNTDKSKMEVFFCKVMNMLEKLESFALKNSSDVKELDKLIRILSVAVEIQQTFKQNESKLQILESASDASAVKKDMFGNVALGRVQQHLHQQKITFSEFDLRFSCLELASYNGVMIWKIEEYRRRKQAAVSGQTLSLYSQPFYSSRWGYKMCLRLFPNGDGLGKDTHLSLFFVLMRGNYDEVLKFPFRHKIAFTLINQKDGERSISDTFQPDSTSVSFRKPVAEMNNGSGCPLFAEQAMVEKKGAGFVEDDVMFIKARVIEALPR